MAQKTEKKENLFLNLLLNIVVPTIILTKFSGESHLGATKGLIIALSFPIIYGIYDFFRADKINLMSALGVVSILLTGIISVLKLPTEYIAIKEAAIPGLIGIATLVSVYTRYPIVRMILMNDNVVQVDKIQEHLQERNNESAFNRTLKIANIALACSFFMSSALNYALAKYILVSPSGTEAFNAELGKMTALSYPVIVIPTMIVFIGTLIYLFRGITRLTGLSFEELFHDTATEKP